MTDNTLLCKECKHAKFRPWHASMWRCHRVKVEQKVRIDVVSGPIIEPAHYDSCFSARYGECGKEAKFWQPKHKRHLFKLIAKDHV